MFNVLILSDIHIGVYRNYNQDDFRIKQFLKLRDVIIQSISDHKVYEVWIAGDLLLTAQSTPQVMAVVKTFLKGISQFCTVRIILGNHDVVVRTDDTAITDYNNYTLISLLESLPNIFIHNDDVLTINNKTVYFHSWVPGDVPVKDADYLVCHGDTHKILSPFSEHFIDCSPYKKVFTGHIHIFKEIGNIISLGTPLMHSFADSPDVGYIVYDLDCDHYSRISTEGMFLEFKYVETEQQAQELQQTVQENKQDAVIRVKEVKTTDEIKNISITDLAIDPRNVIKSFTEDLKPQTISDIDSIISDHNVQSEVPDLRVNFTLLKCKNFLSIKQLSFDFTDYTGLTTIKGDIGAGKSTLFNLIEFMLFGKLPGYNKGDYQTVYKDKFEGSLTLLYKGSEYIIERTLSSLKFRKDGKYVESNRKNDLQKELEDELTFLKFWNLIYIKQSSTGIFSDMSDTGRVSFLSNLIGLNTIKTWTENLANLIKDKNNAIAQDTNRIAQLTAIISTLTDYNNANKQHEKYIDIDDLVSHINVLQNKVHDLQSQKNQYNASIVSLHNAITNTISKNEIINKTIASVNANLNDIDNCKKLNGELSQAIEDVLDVPDITAIYANVDKMDKEILQHNSKLSLCYSKLNDLRSHPNVCPTCKQSWIIENLDDKIKVLENGVNTITQQISDLNNQKSEENAKIFNYQKIVDHNNKIQKIKNNIQLNENRINDIKQTIKLQLSGIADIVSYKIDNNHIIITENKLKPVDAIEDEIRQLKNKIFDFDINIENINQDIYNTNQKIGVAKINNEIYNSILDNKAKILHNQEELNAINEKVEASQTVINELNKFNSKVLSDKGLLVASLLQKVSEYLNVDSNLKVETVHEMQNGALKPTLNIKLFVKEYNKYVDYCMLSGGQRLQADLRFLKGITNTLGSVSVLFLDETFKYFSTDAVYTGVDIINDMNVDKVFLILHGLDNEQIATSTINVKLTEHGSQYSKNG